MNSRSPVYCAAPCLFCFQNAKKCFSITQVLNVSIRIIKETIFKAT